MHRRVFVALFVAITTSNPLVVADEPGWTDAERMRISDVVFVGTVNSIESLAHINDAETRYRAVATVKSFDKTDIDSDPADTKTQLEFVFTNPLDGDLGARCPDYPAVKKGAPARYFLRRNGKKVLFLEMGSDVGGTEKLSPILSSALSADESDKAVAVATRNGRESAQADIDLGELRILAYGKGLFPDSRLRKDKTTGYLMQTVAGCVVSKSFVAEVKAYNEVMLAHFVGETETAQ